MRVPEMAASTIRTTLLQQRSSEPRRDAFSISFPVPRPKQSPSQNNCASKRTTGRSRLGDDLIYNGSSMKTNLLICALTLMLPVALHGQYTIDWFTIDGGGGTSTGGVYSVRG